jgi:hypothetical protein
MLPEDFGLIGMRFHHMSKHLLKAVKYGGGNQGKNEK